MGEEVQALLDEVALDEVAGEAADAYRSTGATLSAAEAETARARAREIVGDSLTRPQPLDGLKDMHNLALSIGLPAPRALFAEMVARCSAGVRRKRGLLRDLEAMTPITETGCIRADFYDTVAGGAGMAFFVLEPCGADHDLGAQLDKIYPRIVPAKQDEIRRHLSMLVYLGRSAYGQMVALNETFLREVSKRLPEGFDPRALSVDPANTTLYLPPPCEKRVGIFVRLSSEVSEVGG